MNAQRKPMSALLRCSCVLGALLLSPLAQAGASEAAHRAVDSASGVAVKVEHAVKKGVKAASDGVQRGVKAANRAADQAARKLGIPAGPASAAAARQPER